MRPTHCHTWLLLTLLPALSCEWKPHADAPPAQTVATAASPQTTDAELKRFLDGMLVTSNVPASTELIWPVDEIPLSLWLFSPRYHWTLDELRKQVDIPTEEFGRERLWLIRQLEDAPRLLEVWRQVFKEDPRDIIAAQVLADLEYMLEGPQAALDALRPLTWQQAKTLEPDRGFGPARLVASFCTYLFQTHQLDEARRACNAAMELDPSWGARTLAKVLLAMGKKKEALVQARLVADEPGRMADARTLFTLGLIQRENGLEKDAIRTWSVAQARWPRSQLLNDALAGVKRTIFEWEEVEHSLLHHWDAKNLAVCGRAYEELGMTERARVCYANSERLEPGHALPAQLVYLYSKKPDEAFAKAKAAVTAQSPVDLMTAYAWMLLQRKQYDDAMTWVDRALRADPDDAKATSLKWQVCGADWAKTDYVCVIEYRKRLGLPTHFNVAQYRDVSKAWKEQAIKNGEGLAAQERPSADSPKPPPIQEIQIIPLGSRLPPELSASSGADVKATPSLKASVLDTLKTVFPGVKISVAASEDLPPATFRVEAGGVIWERLLDKLRSEAGRIYVVEQDLNSFDKGFSYSRLDLAHGRAVVSLARLRSLTGWPKEPDTTLDAEVLAAARRRLESQLASTIAQLLGVSFPCSDPHCALRPYRSVADFGLYTPAFCDKHAKELEAWRAPAR